MYKHLLYLTVLMMIVLVACDAEITIVFDTLPEGDAIRGETLYSENINGAPSCMSCHLLTEERLVGPGFADYSQIAETRVEGQSAEEYTFDAVVYPASHVVDDYRNLMYSRYGTKLTAQELADLIAFLLTQ